MIVKYTCPKCGHGTAKFAITDGKPAPQIEIVGRPLDQEPLMNIHLECVSCGHETVLEDAYIEKVDHDVGDEGVIEIEDLPIMQVEEEDGRDSG